MLTIVLAGLTLAPCQANVQIPPWKERWGGRLKEWEATLAPVKIEDRNFADFLSILDPRPVESFYKFAGERLDPELVMNSHYWLWTFFYKGSVRLNGDALKPTRYSLATEFGRKSLLLYEWKTDRYDLQLLESPSMVLLRAKPKKGGLRTGAGIPAARVRDTLADLLGAPAPWVPDETYAPFQLPNLVRPGEIFSNHREPRIPIREGVVFNLRDGGPRFVPLDWTDSVIGFYGNDAINLFISKYYYMSQRGHGLAENEWLPIYLRCKNSDELVIEKLTGKPYPRPPVRTGK